MQINEKIREGGDNLDNIVNAKGDEMTDDKLLDQIKLIDKIKPKFEL